MRRALRLTIAPILLAVAMQAWPAEVPEPGVVTIHCGELTAELQRSHAWNIQRILCRGVEIGTVTGAYGTVICVPAVGGWVGGLHTVGGVEQIEETVLAVDGDVVPLENGAEYSGERVVLRKQSLLDKVRLDATLTFEGNRITQRHSLSATEDIVVTVVYPFMYCVSAETTQWLAMTASGDLVEGEFTGESDLEWHDDWEWTAAYIPDRQTGFVLRHTSRPESATTATGYWEQDRYHKLYVRWQSEEEPWREGYSLSGEVGAACFTAPPTTWKDAARRTAAELVAQ